MPGIRSQKRGREYDLIAMGRVNSRSLIGSCVHDAIESVKPHRSIGVNTDLKKNTKLTTSTRDIPSFHFSSVDIVRIYILYT